MIRIQEVALAYGVALTKIVHQAGLCLPERSDFNIK